MPSWSDTELVVSYLSPWITDFTEVDGSRTYAVHAHNELMRREGVHQLDYRRASTVAAMIIHDLFNDTYSLER
jgi:hypothetical protein